MNLHKLFRTKQLVLSQTFYRIYWIWNVNVRLHFWKNSTNQGTNQFQRQTSCFLTGIFQSRHNSAIWYLVFNLQLRILLKLYTLSFKKDKITAEAVSQLKCLDELREVRITLQVKDLVLHSFVWTWDTFSQVMLAISLEWWWAKDFQTQNSLTTMSAYTLSWYTRTWLNTIALATQRPIDALLSFFSKLMAGDFVFSGQHVDQLWDLQ